LVDYTRPLAETAKSYIGQAGDYVKNNIPTVVAAGGTVTAIGGAALSKVSSAKQQVSDVTTSANTQISRLQNEKDQVLNELKGKEQKITDLQSQLDSAKADIENAASLKAQNETLQTNYNKLLQDYKDLKIQTVPQIQVK
jgi:uncharacterized protein involved in exopolysaccharide biosynthesis